jgi:hypothetical protein
MVILAYRFASTEKGEMMKKVVTLMMVVCLSMTVLSGCFGPFKLTKKVYDWNASLDNQWGREALFLVMNILPVYGFSMLADAVFLNLIDFWGGNSPVASLNEKKSKMIAQGDQQAVLSMAANEQKIRLHLFDHYKPYRNISIQSGNNCTVAKDGDGTILMSAATLADGRIVVSDAQGKTVAVKSAAE